MASPESTRRTVAEHYSRAVRRTNTSCCASARAAPSGYGAEDLDELPATAVGSSFGCGNPLAFAAVLPGQTVVDLGSGAGLDLLVAARRVGPAGRVIGVDMTDAMLERAADNVRAAGANQVELRKGTIESLPVDDASVDWVVSNCVINLSPEKDRVFAEIARVLRPGGRMLVSDIVADELPAEVRSSAALYAACVAGAISQRSYLTGLRRAGLVDVEVVDRQAYGAEQLFALAADDPELRAAFAGRPEEELRRLARALDGKVHSVRVTARKP